MICKRRAYYRHEKCQLQNILYQILKEGDIGILPAQREVITHTWYGDVMKTILNRHFLIDIFPTFLPTYNSQATICIAHCFLHICIGLLWNSKPKPSIEHIQNASYMYVRNIVSDTVCICLIQICSMKMYKQSRWVQPCPKLYIPLGIVPLVSICLNAKCCQIMLLYIL